MKHWIKRAFKYFPFKPFWPGPKSIRSIFELNRDQAEFKPTHKAHTTPSGNASPEHGLWSLQNTCVQGKTAAIVIDNKLMPELSYEFFCGSPRDHSIFSLLKLDKPTRLPGLTLCLANQFSATDNYYHWIVDWLPRLKLFEEAKYTFSDVDWIILNRANTPFAKAILEKLNIPEDKCRYLDFTSNYQADTLLYPNNIDPQGDPPLWALEYIAGLHPPQNSGELPEKFYISRKKAIGRKILPEDKYETMLKGYGFSEVFLEDLELSQQVALFQNARAIVSAHGAGLTNLVYCTRGTRVMELFQDAYSYYCYQNIATSLQLGYQNITVESTVSTSTPYTPNDPNNLHPEVAKLRTADIHLSTDEHWQQLENFLKNAD